jgi:hypothetical protein
MFSVLFISFVLFLLSLSHLHGVACSLWTPFLCYLTPIARLPIMATSANAKWSTAINGAQWVKRLIVGRVIIQAQRVKRSIDRTIAKVLYRVVIESTRADIMRAMATISGWIAFIIAIGGCASNGDDLGVAPLIGMAAVFPIVKPRHKYKGSLLTVSTSQAKLGKSLKRNIAISGINLSPHRESGIANLCTSAGQCWKTCLNGCGLNRFGTPARLKRTFYMLIDRQGFINSVLHNLSKWCARWTKKGYDLAIRPNLLSDLEWLRSVIAKAFPDVQIYDYTKHPKPWKRSKGNVHLTFSLDADNQQDAIDAMDHGINVAMLMDIKPGQDLPMWAWLGGRMFPVIDGDASDLRYLDPVGVIVGLRLKGTNKDKETARSTGFCKPVVPTVWGMVANYPIAPLALPAPSVKRADRGIVPTIKLNDAVAYVPETIEEIRAYDRSYQSLGDGGSRRVNVGGAE